jgi:hypothetical protein
MQVKVVLWFQEETSRGAQFLVNTFLWTGLERNENILEMFKISLVDKPELKLFRYDYAFNQ